MPPEESPGTLRRRVFDVLESGRRGGRTARLVDYSLLILIVANVAVAVLDTVASIHARAGGLFQLFDRLCVAVFAAEYGLAPVDRAGARGVPQARPGGEPVQARSHAVHDRRSHRSAAVRDRDRARLRSRGGPRGARHPLPAPHPLFAGARHGRPRAGGQLAGAGGQRRAVRGPAAIVIGADVFRRRPRCSPKRSAMCPKPCGGRW